MADHKEEQSVMDKISEKFHGGDSSSSSDSDDEKKGSSLASAAEAMKAKIYRLFGRERPVHSVLGGGKRKTPRFVYPIRSCLFYIRSDLVISVLGRCYLGLVQNSSSLR